jgi:hypothetical protein
MSLLCIVPLVTFHAVGVGSDGDSTCSRETAGLSVANKQKAVRLEVLHIQENRESMWPQYGDDRPSMAVWEDGRTDA